MIQNSALLETKVYHKRHRPKVHEFSHEVLYLMLKLGEDELLKKRRLFSINRFNIFSLFWQDYGFEKFNDPADYVKGILDEFKIDSSKAHSIFLLTMPKTLGLGFNPVSFWLCFDSNQLLRAVLVEVNNTFGQRHSYLCFNKDLEPITKLSTIDRSKVFHVSPFCETRGYYEFLFDIEEKKIRINIDYYDDKLNNDKLISTSITGKLIELKDGNLAKYLLQVPIMTIKVLTLIHYQALILWLKKIPYIKKPPKPDRDITDD